MQKTLNTSNDRLRDQGLTRKTLHVWHELFRDRTVVVSQGGSESKTSSSCPSHFPVLRRVGYITAQDIPECWIYHYNKAHNSGLGGGLGGEET